MHSFTLHSTETVLSPSLLFGWAGIRRNLARMLDLAGSPARLRPHMKTHKTREITQLYLEAGITRHKCATLREATVLAECGVTDVLVAYPMIGPNQQRLVQLASRFPATRFGCLVDSEAMATQLQQAAAAGGVKLGLFLDFNVGQDRTGMQQLPAWFTTWPNLEFVGLHLYDGHNNAPAETDRQAQAARTYGRACEVREALARYAPGSLEIVLGGTPAFMLLSKTIKDPQVTLSPGTCILHDAGYGTKFPELGFEPAAAVLTRCISRPSAKLITFDIGTKGICADLPFGQRAQVLGLEHATCTLHNEEHLVLESAEADRWQPGMVTYAIPRHICPTVAMYSEALVVENGAITKTIEIAARGR
jgi:D-serine deaminase-like pyridoxal phosphate-dependent protein